MVIDTSVLVAILLQEPEAGIYSGAISADPTRMMSAPSMFELSVVLFGRFGDRGKAYADDLVDRAGIDIVAFERTHAAIARDAFQMFGKGHHPAALNFGDCMSYALAKAMGEPLLYKGNDFSRTDIDAVVP